MEPTQIRLVPSRMMDLRTRFTQAIAERLVAEMGRERAIELLRGAGRVDGAAGLQLLRADVLVAIEIYRIGEKEVAAARSVRR